MLITENVKTRTTLNFNTNSNFNVNPKIYLYLISLCIYSLKTAKGTALSIFLMNYIFIYLSMYALFTIVWGYLIKTGTQLNSFMTFSLNALLIFLLVLVQVKSFLVLLFFIEVLSVYYYFFFLNFLKTNRTWSVSKYKNFLLYYLWNSFLTTLFFGLGLALLLWKTGTLDYIELTYFTPTTTNLGVFFIILGLFWKLGFPGFHFFKIQLYLFLDEAAIFFFTIFITLINVILFCYFVSLDVVIIFLTTYYFSYIIFFLLIVLPLFFKLESFYTFLAVSSVITLFTVFAMLTL